MTRNTKVVLLGLAFAGIGYVVYKKWHRSMPTTNYATVPGIGRQATGYTGVTTPAPSTIDPFNLHIDPLTGVIS